MRKQRFFLIFFSEDYRGGSCVLIFPSSLDNLTPVRPFEAIRTNDETFSGSVSSCDLRTGILERNNLAYCPLS